MTWPHTESVFHATTVIAAADSKEWAMHSRDWALPPGPHVAFVDESRRGAAYIIATSILAVNESARCRTALRALALRGQTSVHFRDESDRRRRACLSLLVDLPITAVIYHTTSVRPSHARRLCLERMVADLTSLRIARVVLERCDGEERHDRQVLDQAKKGADPAAVFRYDHLSRRADPLLWPADWLAWSWSKGGDWRRRVQSMVRHSTEV